MFITASAPVTVNRPYSMALSISSKGVFWVFSTHSTLYTVNLHGRFVLFLETSLPSIMTVDLTGALPIDVAPVPELTSESSGFILSGSVSPVVVSASRTQCRAALVRSVSVTARITCQATLLIKLEDCVKVCCIVFEVIVLTCLADRSETFLDTLEIYFLSCSGLLIILFMDIEIFFFFAFLEDFFFFFSVLTYDWSGGHIWLLLDTPGPAREEEEEAAEAAMLAAM